MNFNPCADSAASIAAADKLSSKSINVRLSKEVTLQYLEPFISEITSVKVDRQTDGRTDRHSNTNAALNCVARPKITGGMNKILARHFQL